MASNKISKILFFFDSRATFSYSNNIIKVFKRYKKPYTILVSGNYLEKKMKIKNSLFKKNNLKIDYKVKFGSPGKNLYSWPKNFGEAVVRYSQKLHNIKPDLVVLTGDRIETLAFCITCSYMNIPLVHVQAGDKSGHVDDITRGVLAKFCHIHFAPSINACLRLKLWGEEKKRIFFTGAPQLEDFKIAKCKQQKNYIVIFHPVLNEHKLIKRQIHSLIKAINHTNINVSWIYPNNDMGFQIILKNLSQTKNKNIKLIPNLERSEFIKMLKESSGMIGNSSSGIIEASMFKKPVVNIGNRQKGRPQSVNIVNSKYSTEDIINKINYIKNNKKFLDNLKNCKNPYFKKNSSEMIFKIINSLNKNNKILSKY